MNRRSQSDFGPYLEKLREIAFVKALHFATPSRENDTGIDGVLTIETPRGKFAFAVEHKNSYLGQDCAQCLYRAGETLCGKASIAFVRTLHFTSFSGQARSIWRELS